MANEHSLTALLPTTLFGGELVSKITVDSRQAEPGALFVAIKGVKFDGNQFVLPALEKGAWVLGSLAQEEIPEQHRNRYFALKGKDDRQAWAEICANWFNYVPASYSPKLIGITGTDGKTTSCWLLYQLLCAQGKKVSLLSTVGIYIDGEKQPSLAHTTTPDSYHVFKFLDQARNSDYVILEMTSYGELHRRTWGIEWDVAAITNLADDHLTQHGTLENYAQSKANLLAQGKIQLVNLNTIQHNQDKYEVLSNLVTWSTEVIKNMGIETSEFSQNLPGEYNLQNLALVLSIARELEIKLSNDELQAAIDALRPPAGRVEKLEVANSVNVYVDYAHTPQGIEAILTALKAQLRDGARLHCLFGAEERSYPAKRPKMGRTAALLADYIYLVPTSPGDEPLAEINQAITDGIKAVPAGLSKLIGQFSSRAAGLAAARDNSRPGDIVALLGMGHEKYIDEGASEEVTDAELVKAVWSKASASA